jgi:hypothetical protein
MICNIYNKSFVSNIALFFLVQGQVNKYLLNLCLLFAYTLLFNQTIIYYVYFRFLDHISSHIYSSDCIYVG